MNRITLRRLLAGPRPSADRIFFHAIWYRGRNNPRYSALLPHLTRLDGLLFQALPLRASVALNRRPLFAAVNHRYRHMFTSDVDQVPYFTGRVVADVDDPHFTERHVRLLNHPSVAACVVTAARAAERYREMGVRTPFHVVPQGIDLGLLSADEVAEVARRYRRDGDFVVGYVAARLVSGGDPDGQSILYNVDHLLELWAQIRARLPRGRLWLLGELEPEARRKCVREPGVELFGFVPQERVLAYMQNFDVALYPRQVDQGIRAVKVAEYMGLGIPTVSYDLRVTDILRETSAGLMVRSPEEFVDAVVGLAHDSALYGRLREACLAAAPSLDWRALARRYQSEIFDRYLPPAAAANPVAR